MRWFQPRVFDIIQAMKLMPALPESIFDIAYLIFAITTGIKLLSRKDAGKTTRLFGAMAVVLGAGDAFHLVPRVLNYWVPGEWTAALGIGKLVTSITMTVFYLMLEYARQRRYGENKGLLIATWALSVARIALCLFPQNQWLSADTPVSWGIIRNIPFTVMGVMAIVLWLTSARQDKELKLMWLAVLLSFGFYLPVVLWAHTVPIIGMLMLPKTIMYIWMIIMFKKAK